MDKEQIRLARRLMGNDDIGSLLDLDSYDANMLFRTATTDVDLGNGTRTHINLIIALAEAHPRIQKVYGEQIRLYTLQPV